MPRDICTYLNTLWSTWFHELLAATATSLPLPWETYQWLDRTLSRESLKRIIPSVDRGDVCARAVCLNGVCRPCAVTPLVLQSYRSICSLLLFFGFLGVVKKEISHQLQLWKHNWRFKFDADINHCPPSGVWFENWWGGMLVLSQEKMKWSEALVYEVEFFSARVGEPAGQERSKWGLIHSWYANNRRITCYQHLDVICVHLVPRLALCLTHRRTEWGDRE